MFTKILIANDGSDGAQRAFNAAVELAAQLQSQLHMISVEEDLPRHAQTIDEVAEEKEAEDSYFGKLTTQCKRRAALPQTSLADADCRIADASATVPQPTTSHRLCGGTEIQARK
jgi:nucleotide-binding universal stress UspA family protein